MQEATHYLIHHYEFHYLHVLERKRTLLVISIQTRFHGKYQARTASSVSSASTHRSQTLDLPKSLNK